MKITILVEGKTEQVFKPVLEAYLRQKLGNQMPRLDFFPYDGRIPKGDKLKAKVATSLSGKNPANYVIAVTDVYTGSNDFFGAEDAKAKMKSWAGNEDRFFPHVALHDFEAWLLPYWPEIQKLADHKKSAPGANPETVNHDKPPSYHIKEIFAAGKSPRHYSKVRDATRILRGKDLQVAIDKCPELKSLIETIIRLARSEEVS